MSLVRSTTLRYPVAIAALAGCVTLAGAARAAGPASGANRAGTAGASKAGAGGSAKPHKAGAAGGSAKPRKATPAQIAVARRLFREAAKLEHEKHWASAAKKLHGAIAIKETPGLRFHLAYCEEHVGELVQAQADYDRAAQLISDGVKAPDVAARLDAARSKLKKRVPQLTVTLPASAPGAKLTVDGKAMAPDVVGQPMPLDPGQHKVEVVADGYKPFQATVTLSEGDRKTTAVKLEKAAPPPPATKSAAAAPARPPAADTGAKHSAFPLRTVALIGEGAVTLAGLGVGIGFTVAKGKAASRADRTQAAIDQQTGKPGDPSACTNASGDLAYNCNALRKSLSDKDTDGKLAIAGFIGAGVGAAATIATWLLWKPARQEQALAVTLQPVAGGGMLYGVSGRF